jgi:TPR repeat protein
MFTFNPSRLIASAVVLAACFSQIAAGDSETAVNERFSQVQQALQANCADCLGASKEEFVRAVKDLEDLVASGFTDPKAARLLADSYRVWALVYSDDQEGQDSSELLRKEQDIYAKLVQENPADPELWLAYARSLPDASAKLNALKRAESLAPGDAATQYNLGMLYAHGLADPRKGVRYLERAVELEQGYTKVTYGDQLARTLELIGEEERAAQVRRDMKAFEQELLLREQTMRGNITQ